MSAVSNKLIYKHHILLLFTDVTKLYKTSQNVFGVTCNRKLQESQWNVVSEGTNYLKQVRVATGT